MISREVLTQCAPSALGKFLVAEVDNGDATTHTEYEKIVGYVPKEQDIRYVDAGDEYVKAVCDVLVSKVYAPDFCEIFSDDDIKRSVSVEMTVEEIEAEEGVIANSFQIFGITVLGTDVLPSCPVADMQITRFSQVEEQKALFQNEYSLWKKREKVEENYMAKENLAEFAPEIVEQVRAEQGNDAEVVSVENDHIIFTCNGKTFQVECSLTENADAELVCTINWESLEDITPSEEPVEEEAATEDEPTKEPVEEAENATEDKPAEEEPTVEEEVEESTEEESVEEASVEEEEVSEEEQPTEDEDMGCGEEDRLAELEAIIMEKDATIASMEEELAELRAFKDQIDCERRDCAVQATLESVRDCFSAEEFEALKVEGFGLELAQIDGWSNKVKAQAFENAQSKKQKEAFSGVWRMSVPNDTKKKTSLWK